MSSNSGHAAPPHILFFMGHFNDIDHLVPVAYKLCESNRGRPVVLLTDPLYDIRGRLPASVPPKTLRRARNVRLPVSPDHPTTGLAGPSAHSAAGTRVYLPATSIPLSGVLEVYYGKWWTKRVLNRYQPAAMVFEWAQPASGVPGAFVAAGQDRGIPSISLPTA